jgi:hypothetical protein
MEVAMNIDKQRIAAVRTLEALGYIYRGGTWLAPAGTAATPLSLMAKADAMHGALMQRADALAGCTKGSDEEGELEAVIDALEVTYWRRWRPRARRGYGVEIVIGIEN